MPEFNWLQTGLTIGGVIAFVMGVCAYAVLAERKVAAWVQDRVGPNRVGPWGLLQPIADGGKMFLKEEVIPAHVDKVFFVLAPIVAFTTALTAIAVVPVGPVPIVPDPVPLVASGDAARSPVDVYVNNQTEYRSQYGFSIARGLDIGLLYTFAVGSLAVYGVILAGWSSNSKYSLLGSLRSSAQIISYEIPLGMSIVGVVLFAGSLNPEKIVAWQGENGWFLFFQPLAFLLFMTSVFAECNRLPFDLPEAEQELVGGYHTEYSNSMKLGLMLLAEYAHMITTSFLMSLVFWGGWTFFGLENALDGIPGMLLKMAILGAKMFGFLAFYLVVRWTIPRFRFDQLMDLAWKVMIPVAIVHLLAVVLVLQFELPKLVLTAASVGLFLVAGLLTATAGGPNNAPRKREHVPVGVPEGVTYIAR